MSETARALDRSADSRGLRYGLVSAPLELEFPAAATRRDVAHGLGQIPTGYHVLLTTSALVADSPQDWTRDVAFLQAADANARAVVVFFTLTEEVQRA